MKILVKSALDTASGYGNDGVGLTRALIQAGEDVYLAPVQMAPPIPEEVAMLMTKEYAPPFDVAIVHLDPLSTSIDKGTRRLSRRVAAWTMWEWEPRKSDGKSINVRGRSNLRKRLRLFDLVLSYDQVSYDAMAQHVPSGCAHEILQGGYWSDRWEYAEDRDWSGTFRYVMVGQLHQRKEPFLAIRAFNRLKKKHGDAFDAELHLKTNILGLHPAMEDAYPGVKIHYRWWTHAELRQFYASAHCYLAPSRGEGKNMPALEAQSTGMPVIATDFGGHTVWLSSEYAYPLGFDRVEDEMGVYAQAYEEELADLMWHVYENRDEAREKGLIASRTLPQISDWSVVARKFIEALRRAPEREIGDTL